MYEVKAAVTSQELLRHLEKMTGKEFLQHVSRRPARAASSLRATCSCRSILDPAMSMGLILSEAHLRTAAAFLEKQVAAKLWRTTPWKPSALARC